MRFILITILYFSFIFSSSAQMVDDNGSVSYGNEWIDNGKQYYKFHISEDGIYRIPAQQLSDAGVDLNSVRGSDFQIFSYGKQIPIYTSTESNFSSTDYIEFYGKKNKSHLDSFLFRNKSDLFNEEYSLFNDKSTYFLTWESTSNNRYTTINNNISDGLNSAEPYYFHTETKVFTSDFVKPLRDDVNHVYRSNFDTGEGFGTKMQQTNSTQINTYDFVDNAGNSNLKLRIATNLGSHTININVNGNSLKKITDGGINVETHGIDLSTISSTMDIEVAGSTEEDKSSISTIKLNYPREFKFFNKALFEFEVKASDQNRYFEIQDFNLNGDLYVLYDIENKERLIPIADKTQDLIKFTLPPSTKNRKLVLLNITRGIKAIDEFTSVEIPDILQNSGSDYIIITTRGSFIDGSTDWVQEYSNYRSSSQGGSHNTAIIYVEDLYNQFGFGIERHPIAINNAIVYIKNNFSNPEYVLIIGKGLEYDEVRTDQQLNNVGNAFKIPTYGYPGSDNLLAAKYGEEFPSLPIGRIAARDYNQIEIYLEKVISHESSNYPQTIGGKEWTKKVIHLVGGSPDIIDFIRGSLNKMGNIVKNNYFGADVHTYERNSGTAQESVTSRIVKDIEDGAAMVTFNGHSGVSGTDFNISNIQNDRYPVFYSLGCYSGNIHKNLTTGQSEKFVLETGGVIIYAGTSGTGFTGALGRLGEEIYRNTGNTLYRESVGRIVQRTLETIANEHTDIGSITLNQQFTFHGDPAVKLHLSDQPDYIPDYSSLKTEPHIINANVDSFDFVLDIVNIGKGIDDNLSIKILRDLPDGSTEVFYKTIAAPKYRKSVVLKMPTHGLEGVGESCISIIVDPDNNIAEGPNGAEENNELFGPNGENKYCLSIINNGLEPVYPKKFSIVNTQVVELHASSYNYFTSAQNYIFQIDTTELFNSPTLEENIINSEGGLIKWQASTNFTNDQVYYWRVKPENNSEWKNSSFIYKQNSPIGWNQSHYFQYMKDEFLGTTFDGRKFDFEAQVRTVQIIGKKYDSNNNKICFVDGETWGDMNPLSDRPAINISAWGPDYWFRNFSKTDYNSLEAPWANSLSFTYKPYIQDHVVGIKDLLEAIPDSMTVFIYTVLDDGSPGLKPDEWAQDSVDLGYNLYSLLESYGATKIRQMETKGTVPYIFVFKKGKGIIQEEIGETIDEIIEVEKSVPINKLSGKFKSQIIGPAKSWDKVLWQESNKNEYDVESYIIVYKLDENKNPTIVDTLDSVYDLDISNINATEYPYIQLEFYAYDKIYRDPPKIDYWRVLFEGYPDAVLVNDSESFFIGDTLEASDKLQFKTTIYNNTSVDMDAILVKYTITKENNEKIENSERYPSLLANSSYTIEYQYPTDLIEGTNDFSVEINVDKEQVESNYFNNFGIRRFTVKSSSLPLQLLDFKGCKANEKIKLNWVTTNERSCDYFIIERSTDGQNFEKIGKIISKNQSIISNKYEFYDIKPNNGLNYYRLLQVDINENSKYSKIILISYNEDNYISIYPNPFNNELNIDIAFFTDENDLYVYNSNGKKIYYQKVSKGERNIKVDASEFMSGIYYVEIKNNNNTHIFKLVKTSN